MNALLEKQKDKIKKITSRNSLIELYRFLFALWIVWYHGYFIIKNQYFDDGYIAVEFFFILSGFHFLKTLDKYKDKALAVGLVQMIWSKIKPLGMAFIIGVVFVIWQEILEDGPALFGYLWYIPIMLLSFIIIYLLHRLIKSKPLFILVISGITICSYLILYIPLAEKLGVARGLGAVSLGILLSYVPKFELKVGRINYNWIITAFIFGAVGYLSFLPKDNLVCEYLLVFLLMPMLIYFTSTLKVNSKLLNFLGRISFPLYAYQCVLRVIREITDMPRYRLLVILLCLVGVDVIISLLYKEFKSKRIFA